VKALSSSEGSGDPTRKPSSHAQPGSRGPTVTHRGEGGDLEGAGGGGHGRAARAVRRLHHALVRERDRRGQASGWEGIATVLGGRGGKGTKGLGEEEWVLSKVSWNTVNALAVRSFPVHDDQSNQSHSVLLRGSSCIRAGRAAAPCLVFPPCAMAGGTKGGPPSYAATHLAGPVDDLRVAIPVGGSPAPPGPVAVAVTWLS
jgi:hypothetical protein